MIQLLYINYLGQRIYEATSLKEATAFASSYGTSLLFYLEMTMNGISRGVQFGLNN